MTTLLRISERRQARALKATLTPPVKLRLVAPAPVQEDLLVCAESLVAGIKRRDIVAFCGSALWTDGSNSVVRGGIQTRAGMVYGLERAKLRLMGFMEDHND